MVFGATGSLLGRAGSCLRSLPKLAPAGLLILLVCAPALADRLHLNNGSVIEADQVWEDANGVWYRRNGVTEFLARGRVKCVERKDTAPGDAQPIAAVASDERRGPESTPVWIYLVGGARMMVDEVAESPQGVWYRRGALSVFLEKSRIDRLERESGRAANGAVAGAKRGENQWSTGSDKLDGLIKDNGARHGVDLYLIFCVMEQESHFNSRAVSPAGARGLMQLMPATARRLGVRSVHDPAQNITGGTRYLKELLTRFGGRVDLVLAGYNAGEGAVIKYGHRVPPYRETRDYVKRISKRYGVSTAGAAAAGGTE